MLKFGNKEFRNLQEQVEENMKDIQDLMQGQVVLDEFGIKVVGEVASVDDMPTVEEYKEEYEDWGYGDAYAVGTEPPYTMYILTRGNNENPDDYWFNIGIFPMPGPQGEQGIQGETGPQGQTGDTGPAGVDAGFGTPTASVTQYSRGTQPSVSVEASGSNTEKVFSFAFGIPSGAPSVTLTSVSGTLTLSQFNMLQDQPDSVILQRVSAGASIVYYTLQRWYKSEDYMYFICLYNYTPNRTSFRVCQVDLHNRNYILTSDVALKVGRYNISSYDPDISGNATSGKVLTADGSGGTTWEDGASGVSTVTINVTSGTFSDDDYIKVASDGCTIIYDDNTTKVSFRKYAEDSTTITYAGPFTEGSITYWYGLSVNKSGKTWVVSSSAMPISATNIKSGSYLSGLVLTTNGSGGASWESLPTPQSLAWGNITGTLSNQTDLKNALDDKQDEITQPDTPTGTLNEYLGFTSAGVISKNTMIPVSKISDIADVAITGSYTDLLNQPSIPDPQVQSNWTQTNSSKVDYIKNKPTLSTVATSGDYDDLLNKPTLFDGDYDSLTNKPDLSIYAESSDLSSVAFSGDYDDLLNKPTIPTVDYPVTDVEVNGSSVVSNKVASITVPTDTSDLTNNAGFITSSALSGYVESSDLSTVAFSGDFDDLLNKPTMSDYVEFSDLSTVATTGDYDDLLNKPTIPAAQVNADWNASSGVAEILNKPSLSTVATSGSYNDLTDKPTIPVVSYPVTDVQVDGVSVLNGTVAEITMPTIPTKTSDLQNDSGFITSSDIPTDLSDFTNDVGYITGITSSDVTTALGYTPYDSSNPSGYTSNVGTVTSVNNVSPVNGDVTIAIPTVPTNVSAFTNDAGYLTSSTGVTSVNGNTGAITNIATLSDIPDAVSGTNDGTNWTTITIGSTTKNIPSGGGSSTDVQINGTSITSGGVANIVTETAYDATTNKIATMSDVPSTSNFVDLTSSQTITGAKTFGYTNISSIGLKGGDLELYNSQGPLKGWIYSDSNGIGIASTSLKINCSTPIGTTYGLVFPDTSSYTSDKTIATTDDIPSTSNFVTLDGTQTISGVKEFSATPTLNGGVQIKGTTTYIDSNNNIVGYMYGTNNGIKIQGSTTGLYGLLVPSTSSYTADKTIATLDDIPSSSNFVDLTSSQTISGQKVFTNAIQMHHLTIHSQDSNPSELQVSGTNTSTKYQNRQIVLQQVGSSDKTISIPSVNGTIATTSNANGTTEETWTFTLSDNSTVNKTVILG